MACRIPADKRRRCFFSTAPTPRRNESGSKLHRNCLFILNLQTGRVRTLRDKQEPTPATRLRVSPQGQYIFVLFEEKRPEVYSATQGLLTNMPAKFPFIADIAWTGRHTAVQNEDVIQPGDIEGSSLRASEKPSWFCWQRFRIGLGAGKQVEGIGGATPLCAKTKVSLLAPTLISHASTLPRRNQPRTICGVYPWR